MASIQKRNNGSYRIFVSKGYDINGRKIVETATFTPDPKRTERQNKRALDDFAREFEHRVKRGLTGGDNVSFADFANGWMMDYVNAELKPTTIDAYRRALDHWILPRIGHMKLSEIKATDIQHVLSTMRQEGYCYQTKHGTRTGSYSERTIKDCQRTISAVLGYAYDNGILQENPSTRLRSRNHRKVEEKKLNCWTREQATLFLDRIQQPLPVMVGEKIHHRNGKEVRVKSYVMKTITVPIKLVAFFFLAFYSACRRGEILGLLWRDIDFKESNINIKQTSHYTSGKGLYTDTPKTQTSFRKIILPAACMTVLKRLKRRQAEEIMMLGTAWTGDRTQAAGFVFTNETGGQLATDIPGHKFHEYTRHINATLPQGQQLPLIRIHDCRHTSASLLIAAGLDPVTVAHRLGHSDATTTLRIYAHAFEEADRTAADTMEKLLAPDGQQIAI